MPSKLHLGCFLKLFVAVSLNGLTLASLYFLVASGFTLIFGLLRTVNMAHGSLFLLGAYSGFSAATLTGNWYVGLAAATAASAALGFLLQWALLERIPGQDLRQTMLTIGISIILADLMLARWGGTVYQMQQPALLTGFSHVPIVGGYSTFRLTLIIMAIIVGLGLWLMLYQTRLGLIIRAGVDDRLMLRAMGIGVISVFRAVFALGAGLAGLAGFIGGTTLSIAPGMDGHYLLSSLVVVIVGGMGSIGGAALGALLIGMAEQYGLAYTPTYGVVYTFVIMVLVLAFRPQGLLGRPA